MKVYTIVIEGRFEIWAESKADALEIARATASKEPRTLIPSYFGTSYHRAADNMEETPDDNATKERATSAVSSL